MCVPACLISYTDVPFILSRIENVGLTTDNICTVQNIQGNVGRMFISCSGQWV